MSCNEGRCDGCEDGNIVNNVGAAVIAKEGPYVGMVVGTADGLIEIGSADVTVTEGRTVGMEL